MGGALAAEGFSAYGPSHRAVLVLLVAGALVLVTLGRRRRARDPGDLAGRGLALVLLAVTVPVQLVLVTERSGDLERVLPLQLCDLAWMVAAFALWTHRRWAVALTYYWGLTLTTQAVLTPDLGADFPEVSFLAFWAMHLLVVWAAVYLTWGRGLTPDWGSYRSALLVTAGWMATAFTVNLAAGTNFGYLNAKPPSASVLDLLGPWPWYVLAEVALVATGWALLTWPWVALSRHRCRRSRRPPRRAGGGCGWSVGRRPRSRAAPGSELSGTTTPPTRSAHRRRAPRR